MPCPTNDPNYHLLNDHCIFLEHTRKTYEGAKQNCKIKFGGHGKLYEPLTWSENQMAYKIAKATDGLANAPYWIGVNYKQTEGSFVYESNGKPIPYTPQFHAGSDPHKRPSNKCVIIHWLTESNKNIVSWLNYKCANPCKSICENSI